VLNEQKEKMLTPSEYQKLKESKTLNKFLNILDVCGVKTADEVLKNRQQVKKALNDCIQYANKRNDARNFYTEEKREGVKLLKYLVQHGPHYAWLHPEPVAQHRGQAVQKHEPAHQNIEPVVYHRDISTRKRKRSRRSRKAVRVLYQAAEKFQPENSTQYARNMPMERPKKK